MIIVFTLCSNNYLAQAITLGNSLLKYNPDYEYVIGLVDRKKTEIDYSLIKYEVLEVEKVGIADFDDMYKKYNIIELNTAVKPFYFQYFFDRSNADPNEVIYLDPDIMVYSSFTDLEEEMRTSDIIITPHFTTPINDDKLQSEEDFLNAGLYNLGFIAVKNTPEGSKMLNWWAERLQHKAYINFKRGLFTDQIWINFVPLFFRNVKIFTHPGYNISYWNLHEREVIRKDVRYFVNDKFLLVFYHFSGFNPIIQDSLSKYQNRFTFQDRPEVLPLFKEYSEQLFLNGFNAFINFKNEYACIKVALDKEIRRGRIKKIPIFLRLIRVLIFKLKSRYDLFLD
jgi:hypothetical protein